MTEEDRRSCRILAPDDDEKTYLSSYSEVQNSLRLKIDRESRGAGDKDLNKRIRSSRLRNKKPQGDDFFSFVILSGAFPRENSIFKNIKLRSSRPQKTRA